MTEAPIAVYRYSLNWQDALAYERLPRDLPMLQQITLYLWLAIAGVLLIALPSDLVGEVNTLRFWLTGAAMVLVQYAIFWVLRAVTRLNRARYRYPARVEIVLTEWDDHLTVEEAGKPVRQVPYEEIGALLPTPHHLFAAAGQDLVIAPVAAFGDAGGMARLVDAIDAFMRRRHGEAAPIDAAAPSA